MATDKIRVAVVGSTGYGGVELIRLLLTHPKVEITSVLSSSSAGALVTDGYPHLAEIMTSSLDAIEIPALRERADLVFAATPSGVSSTLVPQLLDAGLKVIDLSGDFRLPSGAMYEQWYKKPAAASSCLERAVYGLTDVFGDEVRGADFVSNPGCYATAALLGAIPALAAGWVDPDSLIIDAKSGVSGAGRGLSLTTHYSEINENLLAYKVNRHQHTPEIEHVLGRVLGRKVLTVFTPHLVPMTRGIMCTMYGKLTGKHTDADVVELYREYYRGRRFVRIREPGKWPATKEVWGSNYCDIGFSADERTGRLTMIAVVDNLVKGAAGQAVHNLNVMMDWDESLGLQWAPVFP